MFIDDRDDGFIDIQPFLRTIDDSTSPIKGHFKNHEERIHLNNWIIVYDMLPYQKAVRILCGYMWLTLVNGQVMRSKTTMMLRLLSQELVMQDQLVSTVLKVFTGPQGTSRSSRPIRFTRCNWCRTSRFNWFTRCSRITRYIR